MARVQSAAKVIQDELSQARKAVAFYEKRIVDLEDILETLRGIDAPVTASRGRRGAKQAAPAKSSSPKTEKAAGRGTKSAKLPSTGKDFWPSLINETPQTPAQIFKAALTALRIRPNPEDRKKLSQRMANALSVLAKSGEITAEGGRRTRLYSKKMGNVAASES
ncbi:hypothetical protein [Noviherbaspirillum malthae]|uniref:hypothetical protein n=1 Tax=Noviherbaspirillum malthae TaxID=1260987 RepID=UPI00188ECBE0|nr:hypothetical protein [Noviherbaspirillum malthae]